MFLYHIYHRHYNKLLKALSGSQIFMANEFIKTQPSGDKTKQCLVEWHLGGNLVPPRIKHIISLQLLLEHSSLHFWGAPTGREMAVNDRSQTVAL